MSIKLYPKFEDVFADNKLKGIFYPLCSYTDTEHEYHFVSSNGLWINEEFNNLQNTFEYTLFEWVEGKYKFNGDRRLYKGFEHAENLFSKLSIDFDANGETYLKEKLVTDDYISLQLGKLKFKGDKDFDIEYFVQTFYEYSINKLNYELTGKFGSFREIIDGWSVSEESPIVYDKSTEELAGTLNHFDLPKIENIENFQVIGKTVGFEFFGDGNDSLLFYDRNNNSVLNANSYS